MSGFRPRKRKPSQRRTASYGLRDLPRISLMMLTDVLGRAGLGILVGVILSGFLYTPKAAAYHLRVESTPATDHSPLIDIPLRIEGGDEPGFESFVIATLNDPRSWSSAGFRFRSDPSSQYRVVLAEPAETDRLCLPLRTNGSVSCQNGTVVALNANRWRNATSDWDSTLEDYRRYMVNHEVGHLIGQRHPSPRCPSPGSSAAVMEQQTKGLAGCRGNAWPLWWEIERAAARPAYLAPTPDWQPNPAPHNLGGDAVDPRNTPPPSVVETTPTSTDATRSADPPAEPDEKSDQERESSTSVLSREKVPGFTNSGGSGFNVDAPFDGELASPTGRAGHSPKDNPTRSIAFVLIALVSAIALVIARRNSLTRSEESRSGADSSTDHETKTDPLSDTRAAQRARRLNIVNMQLGHAVDSRPTISDSGISAESGTKPAEPNAEEDLTHG